MTHREFLIREGLAIAESTDTGALLVRDLDGALYAEFPNGDTYPCEGIFEFGKLCQLVSEGA